VRWSALQCVAVRWSAWHCVAVCCSVLLHRRSSLRSACCSILQLLQRVAMSGSEWQCAAIRCSLLQCAAASSVESTVGSVAIVAVALQCVAVRVAMRCSALQCRVCGAL